MSDESPRRRILLAIAGLTPQVVTETVYALAVAADPPEPPHEVQIVTTSEGAERIRLTLLGPPLARFRALCEDYGLPDIHFDDSCIHPIRAEDGTPLPDVRTAADSIAAADTLTERIRALTADPDTALHVSIAGGRKTMGFYAGYALSLFGRPQDRLSHVLVPPPYESHAEFYYPTPGPRIIFTPPPDSRPLDVSQAEVTLTDIPFVRMREHLAQIDPDLLRERATFREAVRAAQEVLSPPLLVIDPCAPRIRAGGRVVELSPADRAFLGWLARRRLEGAAPVVRSRLGQSEAEELLAEHAAVAGEYSGDHERLRRTLARGMDAEYFDQRRSRLKRTLEGALGRVRAKPYLVERRGRRPASGYTLGLEPEQIRFEPIPAAPGPLPGNGPGAPGWAPGPGAEHDASARGGG